jgi:hypothetical protein
MVGRGEDTLDNAHYRHRHFWFWNDDDIVRPLRGAFGPILTLINLFTSLFAPQPPDSSIPRGFVQLRSFCVVRGVGASLWPTFIR